MNDAAQEVIELLGKLENTIGKLESAINATLSKIPGILSYIVDKVKQGWEALMAKLQEFWNWFVDKLSYVGDPFGLGAAASGWKANVGGVTANLSRRIDDSDITVDDNWKGRGAEQYRQSIPPQREALESLHGDFSESIAGGLQDLRNAIIAFWVCVIGAIASITIGFLTATGAAVTVFGIPLAPPAALAGLVLGIGALAGGAINLSNAASSARNDMDSALAGVDTWPKFVTA